MSLSKKRNADEKVISVTVDPDEWIKKNWDNSPEFPGAQQVLVAFRCTGSEEHEYWLNRWAANMTAKKGEKFKMCHAEILFAVSEGIYVKCSVIKKSFVSKDPITEVITWKQGCVHCTLTGPSEWRNKYVFMSMHVRRSHILKTLRFGLRYNGQPFNLIGYYACLVVPGGIGARPYDDKKTTLPRPLFCTEYLTLLLQCAASADSRTYPEEHWKSKIWTVNPATSHPNMLYALLNAPGSQAYGDTPLGRGLDVEMS